MSSSAPVSRLDRTIPVLGAFVVGAIAYGGLYCFPALSVAFGADFHSSRTVAVTPWTVFLLVSGLASPLLGHAYDVVFDRQLLTAGMVLLAIGWAVAAAAPDIGLVVVAYGIFLAVGLQLIFVGTSTAIARRYAGVAGLALGVAYAGPGLGVAIALPIVSELLRTVDWRAIMAGFVVASLGGIPFVWIMTSGPPILVPARSPAVSAPPSGRRSLQPRLRHVDLNLISDPTSGGLREPSAPGAITSAREAVPAGGVERPSSVRRTLRTRRFWVLFGGAIAIGVVDEGVFQAFLPQATQRGISASLAGQALGLQALAYVAGQIVGGGLSDRLSRRWVGLGAALIVAGGITAAFGASASQPGLLIAGIAAHGFGVGASIAVRSAAFGDVFGGHGFGAIFGVLAIAYPLGGMVATYVGAVGFDRLGSYAPVYVLALISLVGWTVALWIAGPRRHGRGTVLGR